MRGLKHFYLFRVRASIGRIFYRCVDWNSSSRANISGTNSRIFYRCVDWNSKAVKAGRQAHLSHLLQMRGLKPEKYLTANLQSKSHLLQMRGLKPSPGGIAKKLLRRIFYRCVDWNFFGGISLNIFSVASFTDAWIETTKGMMIQLFRKSRIFYRCVDWNEAFRIRKLLRVGRIFYRCVDWNRQAFLHAYRFMGSHLLQMRGLKHAWRGHRIRPYRSHLLQMRGLKRWLLILIPSCHQCRIFYRCVDWNLIAKSTELIKLSRIFYRCVDWNLNGKKTYNRWISRIFYRCVDWNAISRVASMALKVASFTDAWIET